MLHLERKNNNSLSQKHSQLEKAFPSRCPRCLAVLIVHVGVRDAEVRARGEDLPERGFRRLQRRAHRGEQPEALLLRGIVAVRLEPIRWSCEDKK